MIDKVQDDGKQLPFLQDELSPTLASVARFAELHNILHGSDVYMPAWQDTSSLPFVPMGLSSAEQTNFTEDRDAK